MNVSSHDYNIQSEATAPEENKLAPTREPQVDDLKW